MKKVILLTLVLALAITTTITKADFTFGEPVNLGPVVNSSVNELTPCTSADGCTLYFSSNLPGTIGLSDIWITTRSTKDDPWTKPVHLGSPINTASYEWSPHISADGSTLYFHSDRPGGSGYMDLWVSTLAHVRHFVVKF
jgi:Tol biopolymer transport system component